MTPRALKTIACLALWSAAGCVVAPDRIVAAAPWPAEATVILFVLDESNSVIQGPAVMTGDDALEVAIPNSRARLFARVYVKDPGVDGCGVREGGDGPPLPNDYESWLVRADSEEPHFELESTPTAADLRYDHCYGRSYCHELTLTLQELRELPGVHLGQIRSIGENQALIGGGGWQEHRPIFGSLDRGKEFQELTPPPRTHGDFAGWAFTTGSSWVTTSSGAMFELERGGTEWIQRREVDGAPIRPVSHGDRLYLIGEERETVEWVQGEEEPAPELLPNLSQLAFGEEGEVAVMTARRDLMYRRDGSWEVLAFDTAPSEDLSIPFAFGAPGLLVSAANETVLFGRDGEKTQLLGSLVGSLPATVSAFRDGFIIAGKLGLLDVYDGETWCGFDPITVDKYLSCSVSPDGRSAVFVTRALSIEQNSPRVTWLN